MNTVGKTLVVVNLLFALITGTFLVIDFMTRTNWKQRVENQDMELQVAKAANAENSATAAKYAAAHREAEKKVAELQNKLKEDEAKFIVALKDAKDDAERKVIEAAKERVTSMASQGELDRLRQEAKNLQVVLAKRDETINKLEQEKNGALNQAVTALSQMKSYEERSANLLEQLTTLERKYRLLEQNGGGGGAPAVAAAKNPNAPNPPPAYVKGIVEKVDSTGLVQISIGTDAGVAVNNTLEAYRTRPAQYLGMIRIVDANHHKAVGRLMRSAAGGQQPTIREGDEVASSLRPSY